MRVCRIVYGVVEVFPGVCSNEDFWCFVEIGFVVVQFGSTCMYAGNGHWPKEHT